MDEHQSNDSNPAPAWASLHLWHMQPVRDVLLGLGIFALILLAQRASVVTVPLLLAILLAYLFEPVIAWSMKKFNLARRTSVIAIIVSVVVFVVIPAFLGTTYAVGQLVTFATNTVDGIDHVNTAMKMSTASPEHASAYMADNTTGPWAWVYEQVQLSQSQDTAIGDAFTAATQWVNENHDQVAQTATGVGASAVNSVLSLVGAFFGLGFLAFVTTFFFFFTATEWVGLQRFGTNLLPDKNRDTIIDLLVKFDRVISGFIRGRITIAFIQAIVFSIGFFLIGVPGAFILGPVVAILSIVPYLALVGVPIAVTLLWLQGHTGLRGEIWWVLAAPTLLYFLGQALDDYVWTPLIQGKSTGMDTPTILFASLAGGALFGIFGLLIAIPIAACVKILIQEIFWPRFKEWAEGRAADPLPIDN
jgi:predicted PurR-regulated permease PerM